MASDVLDGSALMNMEDEAGRTGATTIEVPMNVSRGKKDSPDFKELEFTTHVPKSLKDAVLIEGEKGVFRRYLNSLAVAKQAIKRQELGPKESKGERKRASYLELVNLG